jgi:uncharacterized membrane-anchored protein
MCPDSTLRDYHAGVEYLERLFNSMTCTPEIKIYAGRSLAHAYHDLGDKTRAAYYAQNTIKLAQNFNVPKEIITELKVLIN